MKNRSAILMISLLLLLRHSAGAEFAHDTVFQSQGDGRAHELIFDIFYDTQKKESVLRVNIDSVDNQSFQLVSLKGDTQLTLKKPSDILEIAQLFGVKVADISAKYKAGENSIIFNIINKVNKIRGKRLWITVTPIDEKKIEVTGAPSTSNSHQGTPGSLLLLITTLLTAIIIALLFYIYRFRAKADNRQPKESSDWNIKPVNAEKINEDKPLIQNNQDRDRLKQELSDSENDYRALLALLSEKFNIDRWIKNNYEADKALSEWLAQTDEKNTELGNLYKELKNKYETLVTAHQELIQQKDSIQTAFDALKVADEAATRSAKKEENYFDNISTKYIVPFYDHIRKNGTPYPPTPETRRLFINMIIGLALHFNSFLKYKKVRYDLYEQLNFAVMAGESEAEVLKGKELSKTTINPDKGKVSPLVVYVTDLMKEYGLDEIEGLNIDGYIIRKEQL